MDEWAALFLVPNLVKDPTKINSHVQAGQIGSQQNIQVYIVNTTCDCVVQKWQYLL